MAPYGLVIPPLGFALRPRAIIPGMFGLDGDMLFVIIMMMVIIVLSALIVRFAVKAMQMRIALEKELRTTRQLEGKMKGQEIELQRLKGMETTYKQTQASQLNIYANQAYGGIETSKGNYGEVECYQHYEQLPTPQNATDAEETEDGADQDDTQAHPVAKAAVATAVPMRAAPKERGDFVIQDVFVVYRDGRLITHLSKKVRIIDDSEIIGSMITAVQTFVRESFRREAKGALEELKFGDIRILMEYGKSLNIALVIRGTKYESVRPVVKDIISALHKAWGSELASQKWDGNLANIAVLEKVIQKDLLDRFASETFHRSDSKHLDLSKAKVFHPSE